MQPAPGRRVAITGVGVVSCAGIGTDAFWDGLCAPPPEGERRVQGFDATDLFGPKEVRRVDRFTQFAVHAAEQALADAGFRDASDHVNPARCGVLIGTGVGGLETLERNTLAWLQEGERAVSPMFVP